MLSVSKSLRKLGIVSVSALMLLGVGASASSVHANASARVKTERVQPRKIRRNKQAKLAHAKKSIKRNRKRVHHAKKAATRRGLIKEIKSLKKRVRALKKQIRDIKHPNKANKKARKHTKKHIKRHAISSHKAKANKALKHDIAKYGHKRPFTYHGITTNIGGNTELSKKDAEQAYNDSKNDPKSKRKFDMEGEEKVIKYDKDGDPASEIDSLY